ncbi:MAG TPA: DNA repair protein RecN [Candidatus Eisenbacteria bacterium]|nr:DNA repair protein RecN [Candidatus Eisenbacteria bacterium]
MLERLSIRNLALVEHAELTLGPGLNALTGETGAGKTLVVQAVELIVGGRADPDTIRAGAKSATVEAEFRLAGETAARVATLLDEWGLEFDGEALVVRREVSESGRGRATVNQSPVTVASLKRLGELLADLHGQHEHQSLLRPEAGLLTLDRLAGLEQEREAFGERLAAWREAERDRHQLETQLATFAERSDYLRHAARELAEARLVEGEEERLANEAARLQHRDRLRTLVTQALEQLSDAEPSATTLLGAASHALEQAAALDSTLGDTLPGVREASIAASESARALTSYLDHLEADPERLEAIESRRDLIARLTRKYRRAVPELLAWQSEIERELETGDDADRALESAAARVRDAERACGEAGAQLSKERAEAAAEWGPRISRELRPLGLQSARLDFRVEAAPPAAASPLGLDQVTLRFMPNPGEPARPLAKIASGGELSRVMLALKVALEARDRVDLLIFDEVDSGIGGAVAQAVGERLRRLARHRQVVCVTHLPMIAALAHHQWSVAKQASGGRTTVKVEPVEGPRRVAELARMLAGERATETTRRQARELLEGAESGATRR